MPLFAVDWSIPPWALAVAAIAALVIAVLTRAGWLRLFGPVLFYEAIRTARSGRYFLLRALYAAGLFLLLLWVNWFSDAPRSATAQPEVLAQLAETFFNVFAVTQFVAVVLLTPAYVAGCISEDKERRILEFLLATDLANREIVFGKLVARVGNLLLFLLAGLPVLSLVQFFGGIDPAILLVFTGATGMTLVGLVGVSIVNSVQRRRVRDAVLLTYIVAIAYVGINLMTWGADSLAKHIPQSPITSFIMAMEPLTRTLRWGDPFFAYAEYEEIINRSANRGADLLWLLGRFAIFHGAVFFLGVSYAVLRLRAIALAQAGGGDVAKKRGRRKNLRRPPIASRPMFWKEVFVEGSLKIGVLGRILINVLIFAGFIPVGGMLYAYFIDPITFGPIRWQDLTDGINHWARTMTPILTTLMLLGIAVRAAGSIGTERDRDTLVSLLTTPLTAGEILGGKFWGAIASVRRLAYWLLAVWLIGLFTGAIYPFMVPALILALIPPACAAAALGLFCSVICSTSLRALTLTILGTLFGLGAHWLVCGMCCYAPLAFGGNHFDGASFIVAFEAGMTPPVVFAFLPCHPKEFELQSHWMGTDGPTYITCALMGHLAWLGVAAALGSSAFEQFSRMANRTGMPKPVAPPEANA